MLKTGFVMLLALGVAACADGQAQPQPVLQSPVAQQLAPPSPMEISSASALVGGCHDHIARRGADLVGAYYQGLCAGKVEAVAVFATGICFPQEATVGQMIRVVTRYIDQRPARQHEDFMLLARDAMRDAWPCRR